MSTSLIPAYTLSPYNLSRIPILIPKGDLPVVMCAMKYSQDGLLFLGEHVYQLFGSAPFLDYLSQPTVERYREVNKL